eukprot:scaffold248467_cov38-Cyclotella_meneghiniana.AAC.2
MAVIRRIAEGMPSGRSLVLSSGSFSNATSESHCVPGAFPLLSLVKMGLGMVGGDCEGCVCCSRPLELRLAAICAEFCIEYVVCIIEGETVVAD